MLHLNVQRHEFHEVSSVGPDTMSCSAIIASLLRSPARRPMVVVWLGESSKHAMVKLESDRRSYQRRVHLTSYSVGNCRPVTWWRLE
jgi:hypothetical protein